MGGNEIQFGIRITADGKSAVPEVRQVTVAVDDLSTSTETLRRTQRNLATDTMSAIAAAEKHKATLAAQGRSFAETTKEMRAQTAAAAGASVDVGKLLDKYDPLSTKLRQLQADFKALNAAASSGNISAANDARVDTAYAKLKQEISATQAAMSGVGPAASDNFGKVREGAEKSAFATQGARRELMVLAHEAMSGDFSRMPGSMMVLAGRTGQTTLLFNPLTLAIAAAAAAGVGFAVAVHQGAEEMKAMDRALASTSNFSGQTRGSLRELAAEMAQSSQLTIGQSKEVVTQLAASGRIGAEAFGAVAGLVSKYALATGQHAEDATPKLIKLFSDPTKGAEELNQSMHFLTVEQMNHIRVLQAAGKETEAQLVLADALKDKFGTQEENLGSLATGWRRLSKDASSAWDSMMGWGRTNTLDEDVKQATDKLAALIQAKKDVASGSKGRLFGPTEKEILAAQADLDKKLGAQQEAAAVATQQAIDAAKIDATNKTHKLIQGLSVEAKKDEMRLNIAIMQGDEAKIAELRKKMSTADYGADAIAKAKENLAQIGAARNTEYDSVIKKSEGFIAQLKKEGAEEGQTYEQKKIYEAEAVASGMRLVGVSEKKIIAFRNSAAAIAHENQAQKDAIAQAKEVAGWAKQLDALGKNEIASLDKAIAAQQLHNAEIGKTAEQKALERAAIEDVGIARLQDEETALRFAAEEVNMGDEFKAIYLARADALNIEIAKRRQLAGLMVSASTLEASAAVAKATAAEWKKGWEETDRIGRETFITWREEGGNAAKKIGKTLEKALLSAIYEASLRPIAFEIYSSAAGAMGMPAPSGAAGNIGSLGNAAAGAGSVWGAASSAYSATATAAEYAVVNGALVPVAGTELAGGFMSALGAGVEAGLAAIPVWGWAALGAMAIFSMAGKGGGPKTEGSYAGALGGDGSLNQIAGPGLYSGHSADAQMLEMAKPIGKAMADTIRGLGGDASGLRIGYGYNTDPQGKAPDNVATTLTGANGESLYRNVRNVDRGQGAAALGDDLTKMTLAAVESVDLGPILTPLLDGLGDVGAMTKDQVTSTLTALSSVGPMTADKFNRVFSDTFSASKFDALANDGENTVQTFARITGVFTSTNTVADLMGKSTASAFGAIGLASEAAREDMVSLMGGVQQMSSTLQGYYAGYFTDSERHARDLKGVGDQFAALGYTMPGTRAELKAMIDAQDLTTESGRSAAATLIGLSGALATVTPSAEEAAATTADLQNQILELTGQHVEAVALKRQQELSGLSASDQLLQQRIYALQDEAEAVAKANAVLSQRFDLDIQVANLTGNNTLARIKELQAIDPANRALQIHVWALQDQKEAAQNAASAYQDAGKAQQEYLKGLVDFGKSVKDFLLGLQTGVNAGTSPESRLAATRDKYLEDLRGARSGSAESYASLTKSAQDYIGAGQDYDASGAAQQARIAQIKSEMGGLAAVRQYDANLAALGRIEAAINASSSNVASAVSMIPFAIRESDLALLNSLGAQFAVLDANLSGGLSITEFRAGMAGKATDAAINALFSLTDTNHDGIISVLEAGNASVSNFTAALTALTASVTTGAYAPMTFAQFRTQFSGSATDATLQTWFSRLDANGDSVLSALEISNANTVSAKYTMEQYAAMDNAMLYDLTLYASDERNRLDSIISLLSGTLTVTSKNQGGASLMKFANGGVFDRDIISSPTYFNMGQMAEAGPEAIMPLTRINGRLGVAAVGGNSDDKATVAELREVKALLRVIAAKPASDVAVVTAVSRLEKRMAAIEDQARLQRAGV